MRSRKAILGLAGIAVLTVTSAVGTLSGNDTLAELARTLLLAGVGLLVVDGAVAVRRNERQLRRLRNAVRRVGSQRQAAAPPPPAPAPETEPATSPADLIGIIRLLQAQYVGRLDRAQTALDEAVEQISVSRDRQG